MELLDLTGVQAVEEVLPHTPDVTRRCGLEGRGPVVGEHGVDDAPVGGVGLATEIPARPARSTPLATLLAVVVAAVAASVRAGAVGWLVVRRVVTRPSAVLRWLVPLVVVVSLVPDVLLGLALGWGGAVALGLMHLAVAAVAVPAYRYFLPLPR